MNVAFWWFQAKHCYMGIFYIYFHMLYSTQFDATKSYFNTLRTGDADLRF